MPNPALRHRVHRLVLALLLPLLCRCAIAQQGVADPKRFESNIEAFEKHDKAKPPQPGGVLFVGSSSIVGWDLPKSFPGLTLINRGFGGSHIADSVYYADRIVLPYKPALIVFYAGENDVAAGRSPQDVAADFQHFVGKVREALPQTRLVFIGLKPSPSRWNRIEKFRETNALIRKYIEGQERMSYIDVEKVMLGDDGQPRDELFRIDRLHMTPKGYEIWTGLVRPYVEAAAKPATQPAAK